MRGQSHTRPHICVVDQSSTHMRGKHFGSKRERPRESPRICVESSPKATCNVSLTRSLVSLLLGPLLTWSTLITTPSTSLVTHSLAPTHVNPMLPRHSYP
ncbi:hypothetical protein PIB30_092328, partial [Stylosanthes scabra]|nr:hypothetical protein [Stylosanthes scabra]